MLNGVACGMIYRPLNGTTHKPDSGAPASEHRCAVEEKQCIRAAVSTSSLSPHETAMTKDRCFVKVEALHSTSQSLHGLNNFLTSRTEVGIHYARSITVIYCRCREQGGDYISWQPSLRLTSGWGWVGSTAEYHRLVLFGHHANIIVRPTLV